MKTPVSSFRKLRRSMHMWRDRSLTLRQADHLPETAVRWADEALEDIRTAQCDMAAAEDGLAMLDPEARKLIARIEDEFTRERMEQLVEEAHERVRHARASLAHLALAAILMGGMVAEGVDGAVLRARAARRPHVERVETVRRGQAQPKASRRNARAA